MWKLKTSIKGGVPSSSFSNDLCSAYVTYPSEYERGVSIPTFHLLSLKEEPRILWQGEVDIGGWIYGERLGNIYCTTDGKNLYRLDRSGPSLFMTGTTQGRFVGSNIYLYASPDTDFYKNTREAITLIAVDVNTKGILWERPLIGEQSLFCYNRLDPLDSDFIMISHKTGNGFEVLNPADGSNLWDVTFPENYKREGKVIATETHVIYALTRSVGSNMFNQIVDTKIHVHNRNSGELVRLIDDAPFHYGYMIHYHFPSGMLYGGLGGDFFFIDPVNGKSFSHYKIDLGFYSSFLTMIGELDREVIFFMNAENGREFPTVVVHFNTVRNEITYKQLFDPSFRTHRNIEVNKGFLFITDRDGTTHIHEWVPD
jgi:hypothetical protein